MSAQAATPDFDLLAFQHCIPWIKAALEATTVQTHTVGDIFAGVQQGHLQLHPFEKCAFITSLDAYPNGCKVVSCHVGGGSLEQMLEVTPTIERWARSQQCTHAFINGRMGWTRVLRQHGYRVDKVILAKEL